MDDAAQPSLQANGATDQPNDNRKQALIFALSFLGFGALGLLINGGRPYSDWYYVVIFAFAVIAPVSAYFGYRLRRQDPLEIPRTKASSAARAAVASILFAGFFLAYMGTLMGAWYQWPVATGLGATDGINTYRRNRGLPYSRVPMYVIGGLLIIVMAVLILIKLIRKGVITL
ncbi:MAG: hypothetical protein M3Z17_10545 [Gemmatimonadota bacterium]|nr:hypothetical protein [Gemmatimonadota bacterium]